MDKDRLIRLEEKIDKISDKLNDINVTLAENTQSLIIHEKRTDLAERKIELVQVQINEQIENEHRIIEKLDERLIPIQDHVKSVNYLFKYIIPSIGGLIVFLYKLGLIKF